MITYKDGEMKDIIPSWLREREDVQAISYAIKRQLDALYEAQGYIYGYSFVDGAPEYVLDLMAFELNVRYYSKTFDIATKRKLIKEAFLVAMKDGTAYAVETAIRAVYGGNGTVIEWMEYSGTPNHFRLDIEATDTYDIDNLLVAIESVKRKTARLDNVNLKTPIDNRIYFGQLTKGLIKSKVGCEEMPDVTPVFFVDELGNDLKDELVDLLYDLEGGEEV